MIARAGAAGSVLVLDRDLAGDDDVRLLAHLAPDEPAENADIVFRRFVEDTRLDAWGCRPLAAEDACLVPFAEEDCQGAALAASALALLDRHELRLARIDGGMSIPELRWRRRAGAGEPLSVREVIATMESYEPARMLTAQALVRRRDDRTVSTAVLRAELARVQRSAIVLNRGLREAVLRAIARNGLSMSEIAIRCGRVKRDHRGNISGETSWLARRLGLLPEAGHASPTPWIHSDVLALIARDGLGLSPREVELG